MFWGLSVSLNMVFIKSQKKVKKRFLMKLTGVAIKMDNKILDKIKTGLKSYGEVCNHI